jgi:hypothetical protein
VCHRLHRLEFSEDGTVFGVEFPKCEHERDQTGMDYGMGKVGVDANARRHRESNPAAAARSPMDHRRTRLTSCLGRSRLGADPLLLC